MKLKKRYKFLIAFLVAILVLIIAFVAVGSFLPNDKYAELHIEGDNDSYILLNEADKYCYMPYYDFGNTPDLKIKNGKNYLASAFKQNFYAYSEDSNCDFIYNKISGFGIQTVGLYIKEASLNSLLKPTGDNIYQVVVSDKDDNEVLRFNSENKALFKYFVEKYSDELNDCFYPADVKNNQEKIDEIFNDDYRIDVQYRKGELLRFLRTVSSKEYEVLQSKNG